MFSAANAVASRFQRSYIILLRRRSAVNELIDPLLGALALGIFFGFDAASLARRAFLKRGILIATSLLFFFALTRILLYPAKLPLPTWCAPLGWLCGVLGGALLLYSLALELPFQRTYLAPDAPSQLITTGTYALTRHPGVLWLGLLLIGLLLASRARPLLIAVPLWLAIDVLYVWLQDRFFFPRQFPDYGRYQRQTPMLWPNRRSLRRCWETLPWRRRGPSSPHT
jgi:protein-S-isoprenylcysteine O-methyltransferase Ste14